MENLETIKQLVKDKLELSEKARNSDKYLIWLIFKESTGSIMPFDIFDKVPCFESIRRMRQKLQEENDNLKAMPEVIENRDKKREEFIYLKNPNRFIESTSSFLKPRNTIEINNFVRER